MNHPHVEINSRGLSIADVIWLGICMASLVYIGYMLYTSAPLFRQPTVGCLEWRVMTKGLGGTIRCERWEDGKTRSDLNLDAD